MCIQLFNDGGLYHIETSPLICSANQWTGFYMITASVMKELRRVLQNTFLISIIKKQQEEDKKSKRKENICGKSNGIR